jgi:hypothetical protein
MEGARTVEMGFCEGMILGKIISLQRDRRYKAGWYG